jgi:small-conductance mechanosensitive channel
MRRLAIAALILVFGTTFGCRKKQTSNAGDVDTTSATAAPEPEPAAPAAPPGYSFEQRRDFAADIRQQLATIDRQIDELAAQVKSRGGAVSDRALANVRASRRAVNRTLQQVEAATTANWEQVKRSANEAVDHLHEAIDEAQPK